MLRWSIQRSTRAVAPGHPGPQLGEGLEDGGVDRRRVLDPRDAQEESWRFELLRQSRYGTPVIFGPAELRGPGGFSPQARAGERGLAPAF